MLRADLGEARKSWLAASKGDVDEYARREQSVFLAETSHEGERFDFHCLRHTCGAWLALAGTHPKVIQEVMRHSTITLTMDTYGHLIPDQQAGAIASIPKMLPTVPQLKLATGTGGAGSLPKAQRKMQRAGREATDAACEPLRSDSVKGGSQSDEENQPNGLSGNTLREEMQSDASQCDNSRGGTRTRTRDNPHGILSPVRLPIPPLGQQCCSSSYCPRQMVTIALGQCQLVLAEHFPSIPSRAFVHLRCRFPARACAEARCQFETQRCCRRPTHNSRTCRPRDVRLQTVLTQLHDARRLLPDPLHVKAYIARLLMMKHRNAQRIVM